MGTSLFMPPHYSDVIMSAMASQITSLSHDCLLSHLFRHRSTKISKLRVTGLCAGNSPVTDEFPAQRVSDAENVSTWWRHHGCVTKPHYLVASWDVAGRRHHPKIHRTAYSIDKLGKTFIVDARTTYKFEKYCISTVWPKCWPFAGGIILRKHINMQL